jgi:transposase-like protein
MDIDLTKDELTEEEQLYVNARNWLRQAREEYLAKPSAHSRATVTMASGKGQVPPEPEDDDETLSPEEWVEQASKDEIKAELDQRGVKYPAKATHEDLGNLLLESVKK